MRCNLFIMQYLLTFKTLIRYFIELNWPRIILNWIYYWIELAKNNFELNIFWIESWVFFFWLNIFFELNPDNFLMNQKLNWIIFSSFLLNQKLNWIIFERISIIDWIIKLYLPWLVTGGTIKGILAQNWWLEQGMACAITVRDRHWTRQTVIISVRSLHVESSSSRGYHHYNPWSFIDTEMDLPCCCRL